MSTVTSYMKEYLKTQTRGWQPVVAGAIQALLNYIRGGKDAEWLLDHETMNLLSPQVREELRSINSNVAMVVRDKLANGADPLTTWLDYHETLATEDSHLTPLHLDTLYDLGKEVIIQAYKELETEKAVTIFRQYQSALTVLVEMQIDGAQYLLRELRLGATIPFQEMDSKYWLDSYTGEKVEQLFRDDQEVLGIIDDYEPSPMPLRGWKGWVVNKKPYGDDEELNAAFVEANIDAPYPDLYDPLDYLRDERNDYERIYMTDDVPLGYDWLSVYGDIRDVETEYFALINGAKPEWYLKYEELKEFYFDALDWLNSQSNDNPAFTSKVFRRMEARFAAILDSLDDVEKHKVCLEMDGMWKRDVRVWCSSFNVSFDEDLEIPNIKKGINNLFLALKDEIYKILNAWEWDDVFNAAQLALTMEGRYGTFGDPDFPVPWVDCFQSPMLINQCIESYDDELLEKLTRDGYLSPNTYDPISIETSCDILFDQMLSTYPKSDPDPFKTRAYNEGYMRAVIEGGNKGEVSNAAWSNWRYSVSPKGAEAFDKAKSISAAWRAFYTIGKKQGDIKEIILEVGEKVTIAPDCNTGKPRRVTFSLARHIYEQGEFVMDDLLINAGLIPPQAEGVLA